MSDQPAPDLTEFYRYSKPKKPPCKIGMVLEALGRSKEKPALVAALATDNAVITGAAIIEWIGKRAERLGIQGLDISNNSVRSHRERKCTCYAD